MPVQLISLNLYTCHTCDSMKDELFLKIIYLQTGQSSRQMQLGEVLPAQPNISFRHIMAFRALAYYVSKHPGHQGSRQSVSLAVRHRTQFRKPDPYCTRVNGKLQKGGSKLLELLIHKQVFLGSAELDSPLHFLQCQCLLL